MLFSVYDTYFKQTKFFWATVRGTCILPRHGTFVPRCLDWQVINRLPRFGREKPDLTMGFLFIQFGKCLPSIFFEKGQPDDLENLVSIF